MQIIKGINKSKFINDYCNKNKEIQFLLIDAIGNTYPFECENLMLFKSNYWSTDLMECDYELANDIEFFLFTNDNYSLDNIEKYKKKLAEYNREIFVVLKADCEAQIEYITG